MHLNQIFNSCYQQHLGGHLSALSNTCCCSGKGVPICIPISSFKQESLINTGLIVAGPMMTEGPPMNTRSLMAVLYSFCQPLIIFYTKWDKSKILINYRRTIRRRERQSKQPRSNHRKRLNLEYSFPRDHQARDVPQCALPRIPLFRSYTAESSVKIQFRQCEA